MTLGHIHSQVLLLPLVLTPKSPKRSKILGSSLFGFSWFHLDQFPGPDGEQLTDQFVQLAQLLQKGLDEGCSPEDALWRGNPTIFGDGQNESITLPEIHIHGIFGCCIDPL